MKNCLDYKKYCKDNGIPLPTKPRVLLALYFESGGVRKSEGVGYFVQASRAIQERMDELRLFIYERQEAMRRNPLAAHQILDARRLYLMHIDQLVRLDGSFKDYNYERDVDEISPEACRILEFQRTARIVEDIGSQESAGASKKIKGLVRKREKRLGRLNKEIDQWISSHRAADVAFEGMPWSYP